MIGGTLDHEGFSHKQPSASSMPQPSAVAYLDVHVHHLKSAAFRFGVNRDLPVVLRINGEEVRLGSSGGQVPVVAQVPLQITTRSSFSTGLELRLEPGQVVPLYYSESLQRHAPAVISPTPFEQTPGAWALRLVGFVWLFMAVSTILVLLVAAFVVWAIMA